MFLMDHIFNYHFIMKKEKCSNGLWRWSPGNFATVAKNYPLWSKLGSIIEKQSLGQNIEIQSKIEVSKKK